MVIESIEAAEEPEPDARESRARESFVPTERIEAESVVAFPSNI